MRCQAAPRRRSSVTRTPASAREPVTTTPIGAPAGASGLAGRKRRTRSAGARCTVPT